MPARVRETLGLSAGSVLEWYAERERVVVRRVGKHTTADVHEAVFGTRTPARQGLKELKEGIRKHVRARHARD